MRALKVIGGALVGYFVVPFVLSIVIVARTGSATFSLNYVIEEIVGLAMPWKSSGFDILLIIVGVIGAVVGAVIAFRITHPTQVIVSEDIAALSGAFRRAWRRF